MRKNQSPVVLDEKRFEEFLKEQGIDFEKTETEYKLAKPIVLREAGKNRSSPNCFVVFRISPQRQGKLFENMTRNALKAFGENKLFWFQRLFDYKTFVAINPKLCATKQPADFMACYRGQFYLIECKSSMANRYKPEYVKVHQVQSMIDTEKAGAIFWLLILHRSRNGHSHRLFAFRPEDWIGLNSYDHEGRKSLTWEEIENAAHLELKRSGGVWDFKPLFEVLK